MFTAPPLPRRLVGAVFLAGIALASAAPSVSAQWTPRVGLGYVVNAPNQYLGVSAHALSMRWGGIGLYLDTKRHAGTPRDEPNFDPDLTARQVEDEIGDIFFSDLEVYTSYNAALLRPVSPELLVYAGAGYSSRDVFVEYLDREQERGLGGVYWVEDPDARDSGVNFLLGGLFRISRNTALQFGVETQPRGATVGATFAVPLGR